MTYTGTIKDGVVVLPPEVQLPEGTQVRVEAINPSPVRTLADRLEGVIGISKGLPQDLAENHDHYLHGQPRK
jgi:hypothetical protein